MKVQVMAARVSMLRLKQLQPILWQCAKQPFSTSQPGPEVIQITPRVSLFDQDVHVKVQGLPSQSKVTLHASTELEWQRKPVQFVACSHHITGLTGEVDLMTDASLGGSYTGLEPMGLFWSMKPSPMDAQNIRMVIKDVKVPLTYTISVYLDHLTLSDLHPNSMQHCPFSKTTLERVVMPLGVKRIPIRDGIVRGTLFLPPGEGPFPGVIDVFGLAGGLTENRAAMLAGYGFAVLALAYFRFDDLPHDLRDVTFDYFESALQLLTSHASVSKGGIGIIATSGSASIAQVLALKCPEVKAFVRINGGGFLALMDLYHKGEVIVKGIRTDFSKIFLNEGACVVSNIWQYTEADFYPLWETDVHMLVLQSGDDGQMAPEVSDRHYSLYPEDRRHMMEVVHYPRAGHLLEPPYTPLCRISYNPFFGKDMMWGGYIKEHAIAQKDAWHRTVDFFRNHLPS